MKEEKYIESVAGKRNPFRVPEGYFDNFATQMMAQLPEQKPLVDEPKPRAKSVWLRPVYYAAACVCALFICTAAYLAFSDVAAQSEGFVASYEMPDTSFDEVMDFSMADNSDIYACLSDY